MRGVGTVGVYCTGCLAGALPFVGLVGEGEFRGALRELREGWGPWILRVSGLTLLMRR